MTIIAFAILASTVAGLSAYVLWLRVKVWALKLAIKGKSGRQLKPQPPQRPEDQDCRYPTDEELREMLRSEWPEVIDKE